MNEHFMKLTILALACAATFGIVGCGGSGAGAGGNDGAATTAPGAQEESRKVRVMLSANSQELLADGLKPLDLTAVVTDVDTGVALEAQTVDFATRDAGLRIEVTRSETDVSGVALARLYLNGDSSARNVTILASVGQQAPAELLIRVAETSTDQTAENDNRGELSIRIGTDNLIENSEASLSYRKRYAAIVSDSAGIPQANASVSATLRAISYRVGYWKGGGGGWTQVFLDSYDIDGKPENYSVPPNAFVQGAPAGIPTEDRNNLGFCDPGEDWNRDGVLTPGNVASYTIQSLTDANGIAVLSISYPKSFAQWAHLQLEVTAVVGGTEGKNAITIPLPILAEDLTNPDVPPPSIARPRSSLSTSTMPFPIGAGDESSTDTLPSPETTMFASPFPYWSAGGTRGTCM